MKLIKAVKKLKFWSKKKRKKKDNYDYEYQKLPQYNFEPYSYQSPPPPSRSPPPRPPTPELCECHFCQPVEPSAPPLPPSFEPEQGSFSDWAPPFQNPINEDKSDNQFVRISQEIVVRTTSTDNSWKLQGNDEIVIADDFRREKREAGVFGCVVKLGDLLFRCLFPCFHISDRNSSVSYKALSYQNLGRENKRD